MLFNMSRCFVRFLDCRKGDDRDRKGNKKGKYGQGGRGSDNGAHMNGPGIIVSCLTGKERDAARDAVALFEEVRSAGRFVADKSLLLSHSCLLFVSTPIYFTAPSRPKRHLLEAAWRTPLLPRSPR